MKISCKCDNLYPLLAYATMFIGATFQAFGKNELGSSILAVGSCMGAGSKLKKND